MALSHPTFLWAEQNNFYALALKAVSEWINMKWYCSYAHTDAQMQQLAYLHVLC